MSIRLGVEQALRPIGIMAAMAAAVAIVLVSLVFSRGASLLLPGCHGLSLNDVDQFQQAVKDLPGAEVIRFDTCYSEDGDSSIAVRVSGVGEPGVDDGRTLIHHLVKELGVSAPTMSNDSECIIGKFRGNWVSVNVSELARSSEVIGTIAVYLSDWRPSACSPI